MGLRNWANELLNYYGQVNIIAAPGTVGFTATAAAGLVAATFNTASATTGVTIIGADIATLLIASSGPTNRSITTIQQTPGTSVVRFGADGSNFLLTDSANGDTCFALASGKAFRIGVFANATGTLINNNTLQQNGGGSTQPVFIAAVGAGTGAGYSVSGNAGIALIGLSINQTGQNAISILNPASTNDLQFYSGATSLMRLGTGGATIGSPTGGQLGAGTLNAVGIYASYASFGTPPASTPALTLQGVANQYTAVITGSSTSGQSYGVRVSAGTTAADVGFTVTNQADTINYMAIYGDGGITVGNGPTGGDQGIGTINVSGGFYVNGVAVSGGGNTNANAILATNTSGSGAYATLLTLTIPATGTYLFRGAAKIGTGAGASFTGLQLISGTATTNLSTSTASDAVASISGTVSVGVVGGNQFGFILGANSTGYDIFEIIASVTATGTVLLQGNGSTGSTVYAGTWVSAIKVG